MNYIGAGVRRILNNIWIFCLALISGLALLIPSLTSAAVTSVTPSTWNIIGLDSNSPLSGPYRFPVGAKVCGDSSPTDVVVNFVWDDPLDSSAIKLRPGSLSSINLSVPANGCVDAYFEVEVDQNSNSFNKKRRYHITAGGVSTPRPRELFVEKLVSQSRNYLQDVRLNGVSVPAGGSMSLIVGSTYTITLESKTATNGYEQLETFINFSNTIFQILSVNTTYTADSSPNVPKPGPNHEYLYADGCGWENNPNLPNYRSCTGDGKAGGAIVTTYTVKILSGGGSSQTLNSLIYDFSGSSYHYNADFSTGARIANIIDPANVTISKNFTPDPTNAGGVSTLTFTLTNPNAGAVSGLNFTDIFPTSPGAMVVDSTPNAATSSCGTPTFSPVAGAGSISFSNGTVAANSICTVRVNVTVPATGTYNNTSNNLFVGMLNTGNFASDTLEVNTNPPAPPPVCNLSIAQWTFPAGFNTASPATSSGSGSASPGAGINSTSFTEGANSWGSNGAVATGAALTTTNNDYVQFAVNTTGFSTIYLTFNAARKNNPNSPRGIAVYYSSGTVNNPEPNAALYSNATALPTGTTAFSSFGGGGSISFTPTAATMYVRIYFFNSGNVNPGSDIFVDNVTFTGCAVPNPPTMTKSFSPNPVAVGATSTLTFTIANPNTNTGIALSGIAFSDTLPSGLTVATGSSAQCGGTLTMTAPSTLSFSGGTLAASASCNVTATVTATSAGPHNNVSGTVSATQSGANTGSSGIATALLTAVLPPSISKLFAPNPILAGGKSTLTFIITNPNQNNSLSGIAFSDTFPVSPGAMVVANPPNAMTSGCGTPTFSPAAGAGSVSFSGGTLAAAGSCTVTVDVTAPSTGAYANTSGNVSHIINAASVNGNTASDTLTVNVPHPAISLLKQVGTSASGPWSSYIALAAGSNVYYKFTVENTGDVPLTSVSINDPEVSTAGCIWPNPLPVADAGDNQIVTCVAGPIIAVTGYNVNTATAYGTYNSIQYSSNPSSATYATTGITLLKNAAQAYFVSAGNTLNYTYEVMNNNAARLSGPVTVSDNKTTVSCPSLTTVGNGDNYLDPYSTTGEKIVCTAAYTVTAADVTAKLTTNTAAASVDSVTSNQAVKTVYLAPSLTKAFSPAAIAVGGRSTLTFTITNYTDAPARTGLSFTDTLPANLVIANPSNLANNCGGSPTITATPGDGVFTIGGTGVNAVAGSSTCTISVDIAGNTAGSYVNGASQISTLTLVNGVTDQTLTVAVAPGLTAVKSVQTISDPFNATTNPKAIPGSEMLYTIIVTNTSDSIVDNDTVVIIDPMPANMSVCVSTLCSDPPAAFSCSSTPLCGLTYTYASDVAYSNQPGGVAPYDYTPAPDAGGYDANVTGVRINPKGPLNGSNANFSIFLKMKIK